MVDVITAAGSGLNDAVNSAMLDKFSKLYFIIFLFILVWFILTAIIMLVMAHKSSKKGQIMTIFIVSTLLLLVLMLIGYFNLGTTMLNWFNI